ncbi:MAG: hypothetical protein PUF80_06115 [Firmicutes bacterium]|nr:hypothetical protein [Bacillota bacterium]
MMNRKIYRENYVNNLSDPSKPIYIGEYYHFDGTEKQFRVFRVLMLLLSLICVGAWVLCGLQAQAGPSDDCWYCVLPWALAWLPLGMTVYSAVRLQFAELPMRIDVYRGCFRNFFGTTLASAILALWLTVGEVIRVLVGSASYPDDTYALVGAAVCLAATATAFILRSGKTFTVVENHSAKNNGNREK